MVTDVLPWVTVYDLTGSTAVTSAATWERHRWDAVLTLATSIGAEVWFDPLGRLVIRPVPDGTGEPVWELSTETLVEDVGVSLDLSKVYNAVRVTGSDPQTPGISAVVYQAEGDLRWQDGFKVVREFASPLLKTTEAAQAAAATILAKSLVYAQDIETTGAPNYASEAGDVVTVTFPATQAPNLTFAAIPPPRTVQRLLSSFTLPLEHSQLRMPIGLRDAATSVVVAGPEWTEQN